MGTLLEVGEGQVGYLELGGVACPPVWGGGYWQSRVCYKI